MTLIVWSYGMVSSNEDHSFFNLFNHNKVLTMKTLSTLFLLLCCGVMFAQQRTITGTVTDAATNDPLIGASISVVGTTTGTVSDVDGNYTLEITEEVEQLVFSYTGYAEQKVDIGNLTQINVALEVGEILDEVVVVGYATQKKVNLTGSVEVVDAEQLTRQPIVQTSQGLTGLVAGLTAVQSSGQPGEDGATLRIRGIGTLGNGAKNNPLILVDGIPDDINGLDPNDIESVSVLKDASAAAIYGSRASNGVILITTKRGKEGKIKTTFNSYYGTQQIAQNLKFLNALGYMEAFNSAQPGAFPDDVLERYRSGEGIGTEQFPDTDWVGLLFNDNAPIQSHSLSVRGGTDKIKIASTVTYTDQGANVPNFNFKRYSGRFNLDYSLNSIIDLSFDLNLRRDVQSQSGALSRLNRASYRLQPLFVAINDDGSWGPGFSGGNPVAAANSTALDQTTTNYVRGVVKAVIRPVKNVSVAVTYSPQYLDRDQDDFGTGFNFKENSDSPLLNNSGGSLVKTTTTEFTNNFNAIANYSINFGNHSISALAGYEFLKFESEEWEARRSRYILPEFRQLNNGDADTQLNEGSATLNGLESFFGRINYVYKDKYLFEANLRHDASSRFAEGFRTAIFPSFSVGWRVSEENFFPESGAFSNLKFRASWGQLGNQFIFDNIGDPINFAYTSLFGLGNANPVIGGVPLVGGAQEILANGALQWETGETTNFAVDAGFFDGKLDLTAEYYIRKTKDILLDVTIPTSVGFGAPVQNAGQVENRGYDISAGWRDAIGAFQYGINVNFMDLTNEIIDLGGLDELPPGRTINRVGEEIGSIFGLKVERLYQEDDFNADGSLKEGLPIPSFGSIQAGDLKYVDLNEDGSITNDDRTIIGSNITNSNWGIELFTGYKGLDLSVSIIGEGGRDVVLQGDVGWAFFNAGKIQEWQADYWTPENTDASYPRIHPASSHPNWRVNEQWLFNTTYTRLRNVTLGYTLPKNLTTRANIEKVRIFVSGQNLATWDNMPDGIDPLVPNFTEGNFYPVTKVYTGGINIIF